VNRDIGVDGIFLLQSFDLEDIFDTAVLGEELVAGKADDFAHAHAGVDAEGEEQMIAWRLQESECMLDVLRRRMLACPAIEQIFLERKFWLVYAPAHLWATVSGRLDGGFCSPPSNPDDALNKTLQMFTTCLAKLGLCLKVSR
jgi:hypothetical protein